VRTPSASHAPVLEVVMTDAEKNPLSKPVFSIPRGPPDRQGHPTIPHQTSLADAAAQQTRQEKAMADRIVFHTAWAA